MNAPPRSALHAPRFVVRWKGYPLFFHTNLLGRVYSCKGSDAEATHFATEDEAYAAAQGRGLQWADIVIVAHNKFQP